MRLLIGVLLLISVAAFPQDHEVKITVDKTTYLVFPTDIHKYDCSKCAERDSIVAFKDENKMIVRAKSDEILDSNMIVETVDGYTYSFLLITKSDIQKLTYVVTPEMAFFKRGKAVTSPAKDVPTFKGDQSASSDTSKVDFKRVCLLIDKSKGESNGLSRIYKKMTFVVDGIYIKDSYLYFKVLSQNESSIPYDISAVNFMVESEKGKVKRETVPAPISKPIEYWFNEDQKSIVKGEIFSYVFALKKFTYSRKEHFFIEFWESKGARHVRIEIPFNQFLKAKQL
jgi:hypothetical protein